MYMIYWPAAIKSPGGRGIQTSIETRPPHDSQGFPGQATSNFVRANRVHCEGGEVDRSSQVAARQGKPTQRSCELLSRCTSLPFPSSHPGAEEEPGPGWRSAPGRERSQEKKRRKKNRRPRAKSSKLKAKCPPPAPLLSQDEKPKTKRTSYQARSNKIRQQPSRSTQHEPPLQATPSLETTGKNERKEE
ncbi:hypothetical protein QTJ16_005303 [Diplocarpon rosae]|uniref:Uncharacterized protein n=1 Tax=Diplocarpon rosae TaxID=946125 RepID=A0AAD9WDJ6_9HELO|nr:hypothetical protein QTJ16_005303 [Diplocarpon rosae]